MSTLKVTNIESPSGGGVNAKITDINGGPLSNRNLIINGAMQVSQRGTSFTHTTASQFTVDRFVAANGSSFNWNSAVITQSSDTPDGFPNSLKVDVASTSTPTGSHNACFKYLIEAQDLQQLGFGSSGAKSFTLSFWVKSNKTGAYSVQVLASDADKYLLSEYTISSSNTWEQKTLTFVGNTADVIDNNNGAGFELRFNLACGSSDITAPKSTWTAASGGTIHASTNQVNLFDDASNEWYMTGVQLEVGEIATAFEHRSFGDELTRCQRYFQTSFSSSPGTGNTDNTGIVLAGGSTTGNSTTFLGPGHIQLAPNMRAAPTVTIYDLDTPRNTGKVHRHTYGSSGSNNNTAVVTDINTKSFIVRSDSGISASGIIFHYEVESEL